MKHERKFKDDDYGESYPRREKRKRRRGDLGTGELWADMCDGDDLPFPDAGPVQSQPKPRPSDPTAQQQPAFRFNEDATIEVKGYRIDLSRVKELTKVQTLHNGKDSFGISFLFVGNKGLGRTIWYGTNFRQRDDEFAQYESAWKKALK